MHWQRGDVANDEEVPVTIGISVVVNVVVREEVVGCGVVVVSVVAEIVVNKKVVEVTA